MGLSELDAAVGAATQAGTEVLRWYGTPDKGTLKTDGSPITNADTASHTCICDKLRPFGYPILSEEGETPEHLERAERFWIIDPLDGTKDFIEQTGEFSIMIGLAGGGKAVMGVVYQPTEDRMYYAVRGEGAYVRVGNEEPVRLHVSDISDPRDARFVVSRHHLDEKTKAFVKQCGATRLLRCGSIGVKLGLLAEGKVDAYATFTNKTNIWDICAPSLILEEAGGKVRDCLGNEFRYDGLNIRNEYGIFAGNNKIFSLIYFSTKDIARNTSYNKKS